MILQVGAGYICFIFTLTCENHRIWPINIVQLVDIGVGLVHVTSKLIQITVFWLVSIRDLGGSTAWLHFKVVRTVWYLFCLCHVSSTSIWIGHDWWRIWHAMSKSLSFVDRNQQGMIHLPLQVAMDVLMIVFMHPQLDYTLPNLKPFAWYCLV